MLKNIEENRLGNHNYVAGFTTNDANDCCTFCTLNNSLAVQCFLIF